VGNSKNTTQKQKKAMSDLVNIAKRDRLLEPGYRYKREKVSVVIESFKGNVTRITNFQKISVSLQVPCEALSRAFEKHAKRKLGISTCGPLTFPGKILESVLDSSLQDLIEEHLLCPRCFLPEFFKGDCRACGYHKGETPQKTRPEKEFENSDSDFLSHVPQWERDLSEVMKILYHKRATESDPVVKKKLYELLDEAWQVENPKALAQFQKRHPRPEKT